MAIPHDGSPDSTLALLRDGYEFIGKRCRRLGTDAFQTRIMLSRAVCVSGEEAARLFYHPGRFTRNGAMPPTALRLLQDKGSVSPLDGAAHDHRKAMFLSLLNPAATDALVQAVADAWRARAVSWEAAGEVVLFDEAEAVLCRAVCAWAGVPLSEADADRRTREFRAMINGSGAVGPRAWKGLVRRSRTEAWAQGLIERVRTKALTPPAGSALEGIAHHRDSAGDPLTPEAAAVELINVLRPTVAVARYVVFAALALHEYPATREFVRRGDAERLAFVHEVRRFYPFFPFIGGRLRDPFEWRGQTFAAGTWFLLDLYGTNRDARTWSDPDAFRPERFLGQEITPFNLVPQGGGDSLRDHRCPGEGATVHILKAVVKLLAEETEYEVPEQDLSVDLSRIPAEPASRFRVRRVRTRPATGG